MDKIKYIVLALIAVLIIGGGIWLAKEKSAGPVGEQVFEEPIVAENDISATSTPTTTPAKPAAPSASAAAPLSYADALAKYGQNGYRFHFIDNCQLKLSSLVVKKGSKYMLDNRDDIAHRISVGSASYSLKAYSYAILTASVVGTKNVSCDGQVLGKITVVP